ncbi:hypothetical protein BKA70DRAFT_1452921 [Coprinopsis sp. MPI-PUGE-AT-0042]|nr:hypothetical protein BKA70DRAFT_1452921 [Coprinopsis sp. MPI-PUGE-AT-0042]
MSTSSSSIHIGEWRRFITYLNTRIQNAIQWIRDTPYFSDEELVRRASGLHYEFLVQTSALITAMIFDIPELPSSTIGQSLHAALPTIATIVGDIATPATSAIFAHSPLTFQEQTAERISFQWWSAPTTTASTITDFENKIHEATGTPPLQAWSSPSLGAIQAELMAVRAMLDKDIDACTKELIALDLALDINRKLQDLAGNMMRNIRGI